MISILVTLVVIGVLLYLANTVLPMDANIKKIVNVIVLLAVCVWLLGAFGIYHAPWGRNLR